MPAFLFSFGSMKFSSLKRTLSLLSFFSLLPLILSFSWQTAASSTCIPKNCQGHPRANDICLQPNEKIDKKAMEEGINSKTFKVDGDKVMNGDIQIGKQICDKFGGGCGYQLTDAYSGMGAYTSKAGGAKEAAKGEKSCPDGLNYANTCCTDPMTCLGGSALSTANEVGSVVTAVGPGLGMALQGGGQDMSGMCKAMQALAGTGASLSTAAHMKCTGSISSCTSGCERDIASRCNTYVQAKNLCESQRTMNPTPSLDPNACNTANEIVQYNDQIKPQCVALKPKAGALAENIGQMANSAISAELCKQQASLINGRDACQAAGGKWNGYDCDTSARDECVGKGGQWENNHCNNSTEQSCLAYGGKWLNNQCDTSNAKMCLADGGKWIDRQCQLEEARCLVDGGKWEHRRCIMSQTEPANPDTADRDVCLADGGRWLNNQCDTSEAERCVEDGGEWINGYCSLNEAHCVADGGTWELRRCNMAEADSSDSDDDSDSDSDDDTQFTVNDAPDDPIGGNNPPGSTSDLGLQLQREKIPNPDDDDGNLGGGGNLRAGGITSSGSSDFGSSIGGSSSGSSDFDSEGDGSSAASSSSGKSSGSSGSSSSGGGSGRFGSLGGNYRGGFRPKGSPYRSGGSGKLGNMGGGGFGGYNGGGGADDSDDYAGLGLSKKKMKELEKKQGTKRKTAGESGGAHQNIFERISKRFQSLCQNKLDCR